MVSNENRDDDESKAHELLRKWRNGLIDLSKKNKLLKFTHLSSGSLEFRQEAHTVLRRFSKHKNGWGIFVPPEEDAKNEDDSEDESQIGPKNDDLVISANTAKTASELRMSMRRLSSVARAEFLDTGNHIAYVGLGFLKWCPPSLGEMVRSPIYLLPVELKHDRSRDSWRLRRSDDADPVVNPVLVMVMKRDWDVDLSQIKPLNTDGEAYNNMIRELKARLPANGLWKVEDNTVLTYFKSNNEAIYRDLDDNEATIAQHDIVKLLAEGPESETRNQFHFDRISEEHLDETHPPEDLAFVLDADSSQRQCVIAAREGKSFAMSGPPGTGKSQTIANIIAQLMYDGKTVLFVSEKMAALDVVHARLASLGLDDFLLELHSHKATRKAVAQELGTALDKAVHGMGNQLALNNDGSKRLTDEELAYLRMQRRKLTDYAIAVNEIRRPLGRSFHDVAGDIAELQNAGYLLELLPEFSITGLSDTRFRSIMEHAEHLSRNWDPFLDGNNFPWRDLSEDHESSPDVWYLQSLASAHHRSLAELQELCRKLTEKYSLNCSFSYGDRQWILDLVALLAQRQPMSPRWLAADDIGVICAKIEELADLLEERSRAEDSLAKWNTNWRDLDVSAAQRYRNAVAAAKKSSLGPEVRQDMTRSGMSDLQHASDEAADHLDAAQECAQTLLEVFGCGAYLSLESLATIAEIGKLAESGDAPEQMWFSRDGLRDSRTAIETLEPLMAAWHESRKSLEDIFSDKVLDIDIRGVRQRYRTYHRGMRKLGKRYREDKRKLASVAVVGMATKDVIRRLDDAVEWQSTDRKLKEQITDHAESLGNYWRGIANTDMAHAARAVDIVGQATGLAGNMVSANRLADALGHGSEHRESVSVAAERLHEAIYRYRNGRLASLDQQLVSDLTKHPTAAAAMWLRERSTVLSAMIESTADVVDMSEIAVEAKAASEILDQRSKYASLDEQVDKARAMLKDILGELASSLDSAQLRKSAIWAKRVRDHFASRGTACAALPLPTAEAITTEDLTLVEQTAQAICDADETCEALLQAFCPEYASHLRAHFAESFDTALKWLAHMTEHSEQAVVWSNYVAAQRALDQLGLTPVVAACKRNTVPAENIPHIIKYSVLRHWANHILDNDPRLGEVTQSLGQVHRSFRELDHRIIECSAQLIIDACSQRSPNSMIGKGTGIINKEGKKKRGHMPVRNLIDQARDIIQRLKPCFMMSPLSVSQFLPPDIKFDVVIFDEASQVPEADAVNCIYRGRQLIVAGDENQLPPTSFFFKLTGGDTEDEDYEDEQFESILERCKAQGLPELQLLWHYRSRHEHLIAFSNYNFYDKQLHTFPSAHTEAPDLGVELFRTDGIYRRGSTRDNPKEAEKVVERILFHRRAHPDLTIGVVALSAAQQLAVETELERQANDIPELWELLENENRLDGLFVKNLENVQGDERDIIILTVGYGPDEHGKFTMQFGPLNHKNGWRRLNVAITRARRRVEAISSFRSGQITTENGSVNHLRRYLDYAERGPAALSLNPAGSVGDVQSPFEAQVLQAIRQLGYAADPQIGVAGYQIDIGIQHPQRPSEYVLGVECDGATYHSSKVARDRDRLRQNVLEGLGWDIHRIWSTSWFTQQKTELDKLHNAIEAAIRNRP